MPRQTKRRIVYNNQKNTRIGNEEKIIRELATSPKRFKELKESTKLSHTTLSEILGALEERKEIEGVFSNEKPAYGLTTRGTARYKGLWFLLNEMLDLKDHGASYSYLVDKRDNGIGVHIVSLHGKTDNEIMLPILAFVAGIKNSMFDHMVNLIPKSKSEIEERVGNDKLMVSFVIDFALFKSTQLEKTAF